MPSQNKGFFGRICSCLIFLAIVAVVVGFSVYYFGDEDSFPDSFPDLPEGLRDFLPDIEIFDKEDPFNGANPDDANHWSNDGNGLELTLINALDAEWYPYFEIAVEEWEFGSPDSLTLSTETSNAESECKAVTGVMKVCNGDYGETDWKGINTVLLQNGWITTSTARMNDHFFTQGSDEHKRQYTMCHEIGHGFGLPHSDESFWNRDLGNCLDYTTRYEGNKSPDESLYQFLADLYGTVDGSGSVEAKAAAPKGGESRERRMKHQRADDHRHLFESVKSESRRLELLSVWNEIESLVVTGFVGSESEGWSLLHRTAYGEAHEIDLGDNYAVQIHLLRATD